ERHEAHQLAGCLQDWLAGIDADLCEPPWLQKLVWRKGRASGLEAEPRERVEDDLGEGVEVADQEGEEADIERLFYKARNHVVIGAPGPEKARKRYVDDDQRGGKKRHLAAEQAKPRIDVAREYFGESVDHAGVHCACPAFSAVAIVVFIFGLIDGTS